MKYAWSIVFGLSLAAIVSLVGCKKVTYGTGTITGSMTMTSTDQQAPAIRFETANQRVALISKIHPGMDVAVAQKIIDETPASTEDHYAKTGQKTPDWSILQFKVLTPTQGNIVLHTAKNQVTSVAFVPSPATTQ